MVGEDKPKMGYLNNVEEVVGVELTSEEARYVVGILKEHLEYYRLLAGNGNCSEINRGRHRMLEGLWVKLVR
jgi:hypothetical protein